MKVLLKTLFLLAVSMLIGSTGVYSQKNIEYLNRGIFAVNKGSGNVYISWRLLVDDDSSIGFNIYRSTGGATAIKLNSSVITATTDYLDSGVDLTQSNAYYVKPVNNGAEGAASETFTLAANTSVRQYFPIALQSISGKSYTDYNVLHVYPGDLDGDGDYDYIVKRFPVDASYNTILLEAYDNEGNFMWRIDLGPNVETYISSMTSPVLVADFDSDGKAEIIAKTGESTTFGNGTTIGDTDGDGITDYNNHNGSGTMANIFDGPEFISLIDGETGAEVDRDNFIARGNTSDWGDTYGARVNFIMSVVGYFDGVNPGALFSRGEGSHMVVESWNVVNNNLVKNWDYTSVGKTYAVGGWTDFHQVQCIDVDGDGKDETSWGACMLDDDGSLLYTTKYVHGDRFQITDINPNRAGLEVFIVQQNNPDLIGSALYDAATGSTIKDWYVSSLSDVGRGDAGDVDPNSAGLELFDTGSSDLHASNGSELVTGSRPYPWVGIWWDGDLLRESFIGVGTGGYNPAINKWNSTSNTFDRFFTMYNDGGSYVLKCPYGGRATLIADIFGDWREEIALESSDRTELKIYTTNISAQDRIYALMQNPTYRTGVTTKGYLCTKYPDYFLGEGMSTPPTPNVHIVGPGTATLTATAGNGEVNLSWTTEDVNLGLIQVMRDTDPNPSGRTRIAYVTSGTTYTDTNVDNGTTYYYWLKITESDGNLVNSNAANATPSGCTPTSITPYSQVDGGSWSGSASVTVDAGGTVKFGPHPTSGGSWSWSGPNGFSATTREVTISNIQSANAGNYIATYTNSSGCPSTQTFTITVNSSSIVVTAKGTVGDETIELYVGSTLLGSWTLTTRYQDYTAIGSGTAKVYFTNDAGSRDVQIDKIVNNGTTYQAEDQATNTGVWSGVCGGSNSEWLQCNGYIEFTTAVSLTSATISTDIDEVEVAPKVTIYPNPVDDVLYIGGEIDVKSIAIYSTKGKLVLASPVVQNSVDVSMLSSGFYIVKLSDGESVITKKLIK